MTPRDQHDRDIALSSFDGNYLISAGAGCGKTSVLTDRIFNIIKHFHVDEPDICSRLLVLTFTNKAAAEMKDRIRSLVLKDPETNPLGGQIESADITTFDAYALSLVKKYHHVLGLRSEVSVGDESVFKVQLFKIINRIFEGYYKDALLNKDSTFAQLINKYCLDKDDDIVKFVLNIIDKAKKSGNSSLFYESIVDKTYNEKFVKDSIQHIEKIISDKVDEAFELIPLFSIDAEKISSNYDVYFSGLKLCTSYDEILNYISSAKSFQGRGLDEDDKAIHQKLKALKDSISEYFVYGTSKDIKENFLKNRGFAELLVKIAKQADEEFYAYKSIYSLFGFDDIFALATKLLTEHEDIRNELKNKYKYILVDEYQDTNDIQEQFINLISNNNVFQVGDIKQSIYGFRGANCDLFASKFDKFQRKDGGTLLNLTENFRTRETVINDINDIFSVIMKKDYGGCDYSKGHALGHGAVKYDPSEKDENYKTETFVYDLEKGKSQGIAEATLIANDIAEKINSKFIVFDKPTNTTRPCTYKDFAILVRTGKDTLDYQKVFNEAGIPLDCADKSDFEERDAIVALINICRLILEIRDNKGSKKEKLLYASIARSFLVCMNDEDLYNLLTSGKYNESAIYKLLEENLYSLLEMNISDCLSWILDNFDFYERLLILGDLKVNYERIQDLLEKANTCTLLTWDLSDFVEFYDDLSEFDLKEDPIQTIKSTSSVRLMTMHASKGLEFPVVYLPQLDGKGRNESHKFSVDKDYGILLPNSNKPVETIFHKLVKQYSKDEGISELVRLLYVACTRAKEKLIFVVKTNKKDEKLPLSECKTFKDFLGFSGIFEANSIFKDEVVLKEMEVVDKDSDVLTFEQLENIPQAIVKNPFRASKTLTEPIDEEILLYGTKLHKLLELVDFGTKDVSWINGKDKDLISKVLSLELFKNVKEAKVFHEYAFEDADTKLNGIIDLLLVYKDHIDIVDYKTSNIDDPLYGEQLKIYEQYIAKMFDLPINKFLLSIKECKVKQVE